MVVERTPEWKHVQLILLATHVLALLRQKVEADRAPALLDLRQLATQFRVRSNTCGNVSTIVETSAKPAPRPKLAPKPRTPFERLMSDPLVTEFGRAAVRDAREQRQHEGYAPPAASHICLPGSLPRSKRTRSAFDKLMASAAEFGDAAVAEAHAARGRAASGLVHAPGSWRAYPR